jgi:hypothetical protein
MCSYKLLVSQTLQITWQFTFLIGKHQEDQRCVQAAHVFLQNRTHNINLNQHLKRVGASFSANLCQTVNQTTFKLKLTIAFVDMLTFSVLATLHTPVLKEILNLIFQLNGNSKIARQT